MLSIAGLNKAYGDRRVLNGLDLSVGRGEVYGLLGSNGAGKTTAINILAGLVPADGGTVSVDGKPVSRETRRFIGVVPQEIALYPHLSCAENLAFFSGICGLAGAARRSRVAALIDLLGLADYRDTPLSTLSGGMQRRLNLAVALVHDPSLLILDEPTVGLDIEARHGFWGLIRALQKNGTTILLTTHLLDEAETLCGRIGILDGGCIALEGDMDTLRRAVPALQLAEVDAEDEVALIARADTLGLEVRRYGGRLTLLLAEQTTLAALIETLDGIALRSAALRPVALDHVFLEVVGADIPSHNQIHPNPGNRA